MKKTLSSNDSAALLETLKARFEKHPQRHRGIGWAEVEVRLKGSGAKLWSLQQMEATGGEPDLVGRDESSGEFLFFDCSAQSPQGRASLCYDREALDSRKEHKPKGSALDLAATMGVELLSEEQYFQLQKLGEFDTARSTWLKTPKEVRKLGGALFGDRRFGRVFIYHNGAESYYSGRGFRACIRI